MGRLLGQVFDVDLTPVAITADLRLHQVLDLVAQAPEHEGVDRATLVTAHLVGGDGAPDADAEHLLNVLALHPEAALVHRRRAEDKSLISAEIRLAGCAHPGQEPNSPPQRRGRGLPSSAGW